MQGHSPSPHSCRTIQSTQELSRRRVRRCTLTPGSPCRHQPSARVSTFRTASSGPSTPQPKPPSDSYRHTPTPCRLASSPLRATPTRLSSSGLPSLTPSTGPPLAAASPGSSPSSSSQHYSCSRSLTGRTSASPLSTSAPSQSSSSCSCCWRRRRTLQWTAGRSRCSRGVTSAMHPHVRCATVPAMRTMPNIYSPFAGLCCACICSCITLGAGPCRGALCTPQCNTLNALQTIGMNMGYFTSFTLFLALNDPDFSNMYLRSPDAQSTVGVLSLAAYFRFWAVVFASVTAVVWAFKSERPEVPLTGSLCAPLPFFRKLVSCVLGGLWNFSVSTSAFQGARSVQPHPAPAFVRPNKSVTLGPRALVVCTVRFVP